MMKDLDIIPSDTIVIYDDFSLVGACRAWLKKKLIYIIINWYSCKIKNL